MKNKLCKKVNTDYYDGHNNKSKDEEILKIQARETIIDQYNKTIIVNGIYYIYVSESDEKYFVIDESEEIVGLNKEYFYSIQEY